MRRRVLFAALACLPCTSVAAEKLAPLDAEFLEYLEDLEGEEEDWTLFEEKKSPAPPPKPKPDPKAKDKSVEDAARGAADKR